MDPSHFQTAMTIYATVFGAVVLAFGLFIGWLVFA